MNHRTKEERYESYQRDISDRKKASKKDIAAKMKHRVPGGTGRVHPLQSKLMKAYKGRPEEELKKEAGLGKYKNRYN